MDKNILFKIHVISIFSCILIFISATFSQMICNDSLKKVMLSKAAIDRSEIYLLNRILVLEQDKKYSDALSEVQKHTFNKKMNC